MSRLTIANAENAFLKAYARHETWKKQFQVTWAEPAVATMMAMAAQKIKQMPSEVTSQLQEKDPQAWAQVEELAKPKE